MPAMPPDPAFSVQIAVRELQHDGTVIAQSVLRLGHELQIATAQRFTDAAHLRARRCGDLGSAASDEHVIVRQGFSVMVHAAASVARYAPKDGLRRLESTARRSEFVRCRNLRGAIDAPGAC